MANDRNGSPLIAVLPADCIHDARERLRSAGVDPSRIHIDDEADLRWSLRAEQEEEIGKSLVAPHAGVLITKEPTKALGAVLPLAFVLGAVVGISTAFLPIDGISFTQRLVWFSIIGVAGSTTIAFIVTSAMSAKDALRPNAAQRGTVIRIDDAEPRLDEVLAEFHPLRIDRFDRSGAVQETVMTEEDQAEGGTAEEVLGNVEREAKAEPEGRHR